MKWEDDYYSTGGQSGGVKKAVEPNLPARIHDNYPMPYRFGQFPEKVTMKPSSEGWTVYLTYKDKTDEIHFEQEKEAIQFYQKRKR